MTETLFPEIEELRKVEKKAKHAAYQKQRYAALDPESKEKRRAYQREYHHRNRDEQNAKRRQYSADHPEQQKETARAYRKKNWDKLKEGKKQWKREHREQLIVKSRLYHKSAKGKAVKQAWLTANKEHDRNRRKQYREKNKDRAESYIAEWRLRNVERVRLHAKSAKANRRAAGDGRISTKALRAIYAAQRGRCAICRMKLTKFEADHIMPIKRGGSSHPRNIQLTCRACNARKNAKDPIEFMQELGFLL